ncbi:hypothetical protein [Nonomuraea turkmeniaca]|uniref:hypothetical protein n=1 Tax=Nonomuraea turkmeniaca TaxID=103838 RepID=UPI001B870C68|nr:hypothetical protein [Nonomuraea turkmeniaca]
MTFPSITKAMRAGLLPAALTLALTTGVAESAAADPPAPALVYEFDTDDITTGSVTDSSGNGLHGTLVNGSTAALVDGAAPQRVLFPHSFHENNFWELTIPVRLGKGENTVRFAAEELPNFDGKTYASETFPGVLVRSRFAPTIDKITIAPYRG